jgi:hypothetical protein
MSYPFVAFARKKVDNGHFYQCVASGLLAHSGAGGTYKYLSGKGRVVDAHVEFE